MAFPSVPNTITDGTTLDSTVVNDNFTALTDGLSDSSSDLKMATGYLQGNADVGGDSTVGENIIVRGALLCNTAVETADVSVDGTAVVTGDIYTRDWYDISDQVRIDGWSSLDTKVIKYKKTGLEYTFAWDLDGTGDSASAFFNLPYLPDSDLGAGQPSETMYANDDGTVTTAGGRASIYDADGKYIALDKNWAGDSWTTTRPTPTTTRYWTSESSGEVGGAYKMDGTQAADSGSVSAVVADTSGTVLLGTWVTDATQTYDYLYAGYGAFSTYLYMDATSESGRTLASVIHYYRRDGTNHKLCDATVSDSPGYTGINEYKKYVASTSVSASTALQAGDRLVTEVYAWTDHTKGVTVSVYPSDGSSYWTAPFGFEHTITKHAAGQLSVWLRE